MTRKFVLLTGLLLLGGSICAQPWTAKNAVFAEGGGNAGLYSLNYDRLLWQGGNLRVSVRAGISYYFRTLIVPLEANLLLGRSKHHLEVGPGFTPFLYRWERTEYVSGRPRVTDARQLAGGWGFLRIGYRYQKPAGGLFLRAGFTPVIFRESGFSPLPWGGLGAGYSF